MSRSKRIESIEKEPLNVGVLLSPRSLYDYKEIKILQVNNNNYSCDILEICCTCLRCYFEMCGNDGYCL